MPVWQGRSCFLLSSLASSQWIPPHTALVNVTDGEGATGQGLPWVYLHLLNLRPRVLKLVSGISIQELPAENWTDVWGRDLKMHTGGG